MQLTLWIDETDGKVMRYFQVWRSKSIEGIGFIL